ncbi:MAG TPA: ComEA family DNA-binding protein [Micromonosporaceae bacterium]
MSSDHKARWDISGNGVKALAAVAVVVAVVAAVLAWQARPRVDPVAPSSVPALATSAAGGSGLVVVAVSGRVQRPGLVRLPAGARVADAIEAAGGALPGTDLSMINLARKVTDGELIIVGQTPTSAGPSSGSGAGGDQGGLVNLNTATAAQLQTLPGVGPVLAERIIEYREQHGGFASVADLRKVTGIGDARYQELKDRVTV